jgi:hypothetical protein
MHGKLFSAKEGARCKKCAATVATKTCKGQHVRPATDRRCAQCDKERRQTKKAEANETLRAANKAAAEERAARRAGLGLYH